MDSPLEPSPMKRPILQYKPYQINTLNPALYLRIATVKTYSRVVAIEMRSLSRP